MKRVFLMGIFAALILGLLFLGQDPEFVKANRAGSNQTDVIIQIEGMTKPVQRYIESIGGEISLTYKNVPFLAARIPTLHLGSVYQFPGVIKVVKDRLIYLDEGIAAGDRTTSLTPMDGTDYSVRLIDPLSVESASNESGYSQLFYSGADQIWGETHMGRGSVIAVVDTGTVPNLCLQHAVIGAPGYPQGFNAIDDDTPATHPANHWHGTHVGGILASNCYLDLSSQPQDPLYQAVTTHLPFKNGILPVLGQAPAAQLYPVKVFPTMGGGSPVSVILKGLDHILSLKRENLLDIDIVNLSFGGPTWYDGRDILDTALAEFRKENIFVVSAAGNAGSLPNSLASPGTSFDSIAVGALDYAQNSRMVYEYLGLASIDFGQPGMGMIMRPGDETRVADLSSRGPTSDGRAGPDLVASGMWSYQFGPSNQFGWFSGTSFSAPVVSGVAALLNAYYEGQHGPELDTPWEDLRNSLLASADLNGIGASWQDINAAGHGAVDAVAAFGLFKSGEIRDVQPLKTAKIKPNILGNPMSAENRFFESGLVQLNPSESYPLTMEIAPATTKVKVEVFDILTEDNAERAYWPNALKVQVQSAKRSDFDIPINNYWDPNLSGRTFTIEMEDGLWQMTGFNPLHLPLEPGLMKISLMGDFANQSPVSFRVRVTRENDNSSDPEKPVAKSIFKLGDEFKIPVEVPQGVSQATLKLVWNRDWTKFPTSDIDMYIYNPAGELASSNGVTANSPELVEIIDPEAGTWIVEVKAVEVYKPDIFRLFLSLDYQQPESSELVKQEQQPFDIIAQHPESDSGTADDTSSTYNFWLPLIP